MGLFDMFGVGGGKVAIQPQSAHVSAGGALAGMIGFQGGSRPQQITNITIRLVMDQTTMEMSQQGPRQSTRTRDVVPAQAVTSAFTSTPGQVQQFPFNLMIPPGVPNTTPGAVKYRLVASADIDGEIDPGANVEIQVVGGVAAQAPSAMSGAMPNAMPGAMPMGAQQASAMKAQLNAQHQAQPFAKAAPDPHAAKKAMDPHAKGGFTKAGGGFEKGAPAKGGGGVSIGMHVYAQWQDGNWHPARVVALQNGVIGVDWDDPKLGQSSWVQPTQVRPR